MVCKGRGKVTGDEWLRLCLVYEGIKHSPGYVISHAIPYDTTLTLPPNSHSDPFHSIASFVSFQPHLPHYTAT